MKTPDDWPPAILELVDRGGEPPDPDDAEVRAILDRYPEHRDDVATFLWLRREVHDATADDPTAPETPIPASTRAALRARAAEALERSMPTARDETPAATPTRRDEAAPTERSPRILRIVPWIAAAAGILWLAFVIFSNDPEPIREGPSYAARFEARRITLRAADEPTVVLRVRATLPESGHLVVIGAQPDGAAFAIYPRLGEDGASYEGVHGPFDAGSEFVFPPVTEPGLAMPDFGGDLTVTFAMTSTELGADELRDLVAAIDSASRAAENTTRQRAIERALRERCHAVATAVLAPADID